MPSAGEPFVKFLASNQRANIPAALMFNLWEEDHEST
jgi:hypothetical protein